MKTDRQVALVALAVAVISLVVSIVGYYRDPLGTDISKYDLSSPENTLRSLNKMVASQDARAAWQLLRSVMEAEAGPEAKLFLSEDVKIQVLKSVEVTDSGNTHNNGLIISFVKFSLSGVDYHTVHCFRKDQSNRFTMGGTFIAPYGAEKQTDQDRAFEAAIEEFKKTGKLL